MRRAIALLALVAGCGGRGVVEVQVTSNGVVADVDHLHVTLMNGGQTATVDVPLPNRPVAISASAPQSFALGFDKARSGDLDVTVEAQDAGNAVLAAAKGRGTIDPGKNTQVTVTLPGAAVTDGGADDGGGGNPDMVMPIMPRGQVLAADTVLMMPMGTVRFLIVLPAIPVIAQSDYSDVVGGVGCVANHTDPNEPRPPDLDAGNLVLTGWHGGLTLAGAPPEPRVTCSRPQGFYQCAFGDFYDPTQDTFNYPLDPNQPLFTAADLLNIQALGGPDLPPWNVDLQLPLDPPTVTDALGGLSYRPPQDVTLHFDCQGGCGDSTAVAAVFLISNGSGSAGHIQCVGPAAANQILIPRAAIEAALANDPNIDRAITVVMRLSPPSYAQDANGQPAVVLAGGRGVGGLAPQ